jgi:hypothetical protein
MQKLMQLTVTGNILIYPTELFLIIPQKKSQSLWGFFVFLAKARKIGFFYCRMYKIAQKSRPIYIERDH